MIEKKLIDSLNIRLRSYNELLKEYEQENNKSGSLLCRGRILVIEDLLKEIYDGKFD